MTNVRLMIKKQEGRLEMKRKGIVWKSLVSLGVGALVVIGVKKRIDCKK